MVEGRRHWPRSRDQTGATRLHPVSAADPPVPAGSRSCRNVHRHSGARLRRLASRLWCLVAARVVPAGQPDRLHCLGGQPVAAGHHHSVRWKHRGWSARLADCGARYAGGWRPGRGGSRQGRAPHGGHPDLRAGRPARLARQLGSSLGLGCTGGHGPGGLRDPGAQRAAVGLSRRGGPARGAVRRMAGLPVGAATGPRRVLGRPDLDSAEHQSRHVSSAWRPSLVLRVPLAWFSAHHRQPLCAGRNRGVRTAHCSGGAPGARASPPGAGRDCARRER